MSSNNEPMIKLEPGGKAPVLSYKVPEPTSYSGRNFIEMQLTEDYFKPNSKIIPPRTPTKNLDLSAIKNEVLKGMKSGFANKLIFPNIGLITDTIRFVEKPNPGLVPISSIPLSTKLAQLDADEVTSMIQEGKKLNIYKSMYGTFTHNYITEPTIARPRLLLVETYRLSSYLGTYGAGRTIKTFSLLPGEKTKISIKTYLKKETDAKDASSILDSFTQESSDDFEKSIQAEQSDTQKYSENFKYHAEASAECSWGFGSAKVSGGVKGGSNSAREEFAKNVSNATAKHAAKASAKRDIQINTSFEVKKQTGEETDVEREIQNINVSRTLNFVFRQMNQEFITLLHLVDVRVAFFNGFAESRREVALPELDSLLEEFIVNGPSTDPNYKGKTKCQEVRGKVIEQLENIFDYKDRQHIFVEEKPFKDINGKEIPGTAYLRVKKDYTSTYKDDATGTEIPVPGIILSAKKYTLRTDGVIVDAILGQGDALDVYSHGLQDEAVRNHELNNTLLESTIEKNQLAMKIVQGKETESAKIFAQVFPPPKVIEKEKDSDNG